MHEKDVTVFRTPVCCYSLTIILTKELNSFKPEGADSLSYKVLSDVSIAYLDFSDCYKVQFPFD